MSSPLADVWKEVAADLGLYIVAPFRLALPDGTNVDVDVLLKNFGAEKGILLTTDFAMWENMSALASIGYGVSILSPPRQGEAYDRQTYIEVLSDWGWSGTEREKPEWLQDPPDPDEER